MSQGNYIFRLFDIMEEFGEDTDIPYAYVTSATAEPEWHYMRHQDVDGMGLFYRALRDQGVAIDVPQYNGEVPGRWQRFRLARQKFKAKTPAPVQWRHWQPGTDTRVVRHGHTLQGMLLTEAETAAAIARAKSLGVTLNTYLLWTLNQVTARALTVGNSERAWGNTVNLRGCVPASDIADNQSSIVTVAFNDDDSPTQLHQNIRDLLARGMHWGSWDFLSTVCRFGPNLVRKQIRRYYSSNNSQMGTFSNMGVWNWSTDKGAAPYLYFCPPCTRTAPVAAAAGTLNGRMSLTLGLHQFLGVDGEQGRVLLREWAQALLGQ